MRLPLYSSAGDRTIPNLVGLQHPALANLPTQLVCPFRAGISLTPLRLNASWNGDEYVIACDLIRPIRTTALRQIGTLDGETSLVVLETFKRMLAER